MVAQTFDSALRKQRHTDLCDFKASRMYRVTGQPGVHSEILISKEEEKGEEKG